MNRITSFDQELGVATLEPGVTQGQLHRYLVEHDLNYMVPVTGAGPNTSIVGNALERGYGITPNADHFLALTSVEAVLANGELYQPPLLGLGAATAEGAFKWGVGPYLDGIFTQGAFGIVTRASIALSRRPEVVEIFYFRLESDEVASTYARCARNLLESLGSLVGGINVMNAHRMLAMTAAYPGRSMGRILSEDEVSELLARNGLPRWFGVGSLYGSRETIMAAHHVVARTLRPVSAEVKFVSRRVVNRFARAARLLPSVIVRQQHKRRRQENAHFDIAEGIPSEVALPLSYWRSGVRMPAANLDPARDRCGLLWYSPIVPMKESVVREAVAMVRAVCVKNCIEPLMTLTALTPRCFDLTVPILFSQLDASQSERAKNCLDELFEAGRRIGIAPYRIGIQSMRTLVQPSPYWRLVSALKSAADPQGIISPGRYTLPHSTDDKRSCDSLAPSAEHPGIP